MYIYDGNHVHGWRDKERKIGRVIESKYLHWGVVVDGVRATGGSGGGCGSV